MIEKVKAFILRFNFHSKVFIIAVFSIFFIILIIASLQFRVNQSQENKTSQNIPVPKPTLTPGRDYAEGRISVKFAEGMTDQKINSILVEYNAQILSTITGINVKVVEVPVGQEDIVRKKLIEQGVVKYADLDYVGRVQFAPNDTEFAKQYGLKNTGQSIRGQAGTPNADIKTDKAWDITKGTGIKVAVLDSGIDESHPDLSAKIILKKAFTVDPITDKFGHGTHVAGILSASTNNSQGIAGTCPDCSLMIGKVIEDRNVVYYTVAASGITWAADNGAKVINMSFGGYQGDNTMGDAIAYAWGKGAVLVSAAGNDNNTSKFYPAAYPNVVSVAATNNKDEKASFSNYGNWISVAAPGKDIYSTFPTYAHSFQNAGLTYGYLDGTSMASPIVAGVIGLIWSTPYGTTNQAVVDRLFSTADKINGTGTSWQHGRINAQAAVTAGSISPSISPPLSQVPTVTGVSPTNPAPTFVCGGSPNSICNPSSTISPGATNTPTRVITQDPGLTGSPIITPTITPGPVDPCLDVRDPGFVQKIIDWVTKIRQQFQDFFNSIAGNPNQTPPTVTPPCIKT
ncbi:MAG TPA: S8 family peptidase [Candidatus Limnocylindrales bacterium]|nr:S8 family peptidase [Candidatus Limnocylindrales bacterium]